MKFLLSFLLPGALFAANPLPPCCRPPLASGPPTDKSLYLLESTWTSDVGRNIKLGALRGRPQLVAMFFTHCEYACPIVVGELKAIERSLPEDVLAKIDFLLVSFDAQRDTASELAAFRANRQLPTQRWTLLRGATDDARELAALLGVNYLEDARGQFAHSNLITLLNAEGEIVFQQVGLKQDPTALMAAIKKASLGEPVGPTSKSESTALHLGEIKGAPDLEVGSTGQHVQPPLTQSFEAEQGKFRFTLDLTDAPDFGPWSAQELQPVLQQWYPKLVALLPSAGFVAPSQVRLRFRNDMGKTPASASGTAINLNAQWFRRELKGQALGAVVHELVHVVQGYGGVQPKAVPPPGWLVEGIADYVRWFLYEPQSHGAELSKEKLAQAHHDASYRVSANFLYWVSASYERDLVPKLNAAAREGRDIQPLWKALTGKSVEQLELEWKQQP